KDLGRAMPSHAVALHFLAQTYGDVEKLAARSKLREVLMRGVTCAAAAQSADGGWFYTARLEAGDRANGSMTTLLMLAALREARNSGIAVPKQVIQMGSDYLKKATGPKGGIVYRLNRQGQLEGEERPALTAAAVALAATMGEFRDPSVAKWLKFCEG